jgi:hypothetical protein
VSVSEGFHPPWYTRTPKSCVLQGNLLRPSFASGTMKGTLGET